MASAREWLIAGAPGASTAAEVLAGTCARLIEEGVPVSRAEAYVRTLHPLVAGRAFEWTPETGCRAIESGHGDDLETASAVVRSVFRDGAAHRDRTHGMDVIALPFAFTSGEVHAVAFATTCDGGFSAPALATIEAVVPPLTRLAEILALRRSAANVLTAYVGRDAGARVMAGQIRRGDIELIEAAIWFSDMRGFSRISNSKQPREVIDLLNELFDFQVPAIERHGGEVLKFIGDGLLAIFTPSGGDLRDACTRALAASQDALTALAARNAGTIEPLRIGIALHVGEVAYGNIGGAARLDFTCIGRAVNLAARIESLTAATGRDILASEEFARLCGGLERVGAFEVKGFATPVAAFAPTGK